MNNVKLPRHQFWGAGEPDCPRDLKGANGELHTMRCKVCGDGWRKSIDVCFAAVPKLSLQEMDALGRAYFNGPLNANEEMFGRAVERAARRRLLGIEERVTAALECLEDNDNHGATVILKAALGVGGTHDR